MSLATNGIPNSHKADKQLPGLPKRCIATKRGSNPPLRCTKSPEPGMKVCKRHGGSTQAAVEKSGERKAEASLIKLGVPVTVEPRQALLDQVYLAYGMVQSAQLMTQELDPEDLESEDREVRGNAKARIYMLEQWSDRAARISKMALDAGIEERMVRLAERQGDAIVAVIRSIVLGLELSPEQAQEAYVIAANELRGLTDNTPRNVTPQVAS